MPRSACATLLVAVASALLVLAAPPARAAGPVVTGARPVERSAVDAVLRRFGAMGAVEISFATQTRQGVGRGRVVAVRCRPGRTIWTTLERRWYASVLAGELARRLRDAGERVVGIGRADVRCGTYERSIEVPHAPFENDPPRFAPAGQLRARLVERAAAAGLRLRSVDVRPIDGVAAHVVVRLRERELLDVAAHGWRSALIADAPGAYSTLLEVEAPDGRTLYASGYEILSNGGDAGPYGGIVDAASPPPTIPARYAGPTRLDVVYTRLVRRGERVRHVVIDCADATLAEPCATLLRRRWEYVVPLPSDEGCTGIPGDRVAIRGTFGGIDVELGFDACTRIPLRRWWRLVRTLPPAPPESPDAPAAARRR